ncbi:hypothetical protein MRX96_054509 [Rhipicephalus microplus]
MTTGAREYIQKPPRRAGRRHHETSKGFTLADFSLKSSDHPFRKVHIPPRFEARFPTEHMQGCGCSFASTSRYRACTSSLARATARARNSSRVAELASQVL